MTVKKKKSHKNKFHKLTFKFSKREFEVLGKCAQLESTTINKFIKRNIRNGIDEMMPRLKTWFDQLQPENQLNLFEDENITEKPVQTSMVEEYSNFYSNENNKNQ